MTEKSLICFICLCLFKTQGSHAIRGQSTVLDDFDEVYVDRVQSDPSDKEFDDYESDFEDETLSIERTDQDPGSKFDSAEKVTESTDIVLDLVESSNERKQNT